MTTNQTEQDRCKRHDAALDEQGTCDGCTVEYDRHSRAVGR